MMSAKDAKAMSNSKVDELLKPIHVEVHAAAFAGLTEAPPRPKKELTPGMIDRLIQLGFSISYEKGQTKADDTYRISWTHLL